MTDIIIWKTETMTLYPIMFVSNSYTFSQVCVCVCEGVCKGWNGGQIVMFYSDLKFNLKLDYVIIRHR